MTKTTPNHPSGPATGEGVAPRLKKRPWLLGLSVVLLLIWCGFLISMALR